jgi:hypothetical protein
MAQNDEQQGLAYSQHLERLHDQKEKHDAAYDTALDNRTQDWGVPRPGQSEPDSKPDRLGPMSPGR